MDRDWKGDVSGFDLDKKEEHKTNILQVRAVMMRKAEFLDVRSAEGA